MSDMRFTVPDFLITPLIGWTEINHRHHRTHACKHYNFSAGAHDVEPHYISINLSPDAFPGEEAYLLNYYDQTGIWITDTWHETLELAFSQAEFEFKHSKKTWKNESGLALLAERDSYLYDIVCRIR